MDSSPSTDGAGDADAAVFSWFATQGHAIAGPREWEPAYLGVGHGPLPWDQLTLTRNGEVLPLTQRRLGDAVRTVAEWPPSNPGRYDLTLTGAQRSVQGTVHVEAAKLSPASVHAMLADLNHSLPAGLALSLQRAGGLAGVELSNIKSATPTGELYRLTLAVEGAGDQMGLRHLLPAVARAPHEILEAHTVMVRSERLQRPRPAGLVRALATASNVGSGRQPITLPDERVRPTRDVYENRVVKAAVQAVVRRLRHLGGLVRSDPALAAQVAALTRTVAEASRPAGFLDDVSELGGPPDRLTMTLLKRREYRAALELLLNLQRSVQVTLDDPQLSEPMQNLPSLYQTWCTLQVYEALLDLAAQHGYTVKEQHLARTLPGSVLVRVIPDGRPLLILVHPRSARRITVTPERTFGRSPQGGAKTTAQAVYSVSFSQRPDVVIEVQEPSGAVALWLLDPKYKLDSERGAGASDDADTTPPGEPKKVDIDKMHAYRDALRDAAGAPVVRLAAILYPGPDRTYSRGLAAVSARPANRDAFRTQVARTFRSVFEVLPDSTAPGPE